MDALNAVTTVTRPVGQARVDRSATSRQQEDRANSSQKQAPDAKAISRAAERVNKSLQAFNQRMSFSFLDNGEIVVRLIDPKTGEVVRQIPSEQLLAIQGDQNKVVGLFVNDKA